MYRRLVYEANSTPSIFISSSSHLSSLPSSYASSTDKSTKFIIAIPTKRNLQSATINTTIIFEFNVNFKEFASQNHLSETLNYCHVGNNDITFNLNCPFFILGKFVAWDNPCATVSNHARCIECAATNGKFVFSFSSLDLM